MPRSYGDFSRPAYRDPRWMETHWFSATTESNIRLHFWTGFRLNTGVATTKVYAFSRMCDSVLDMEMCDMQYNSPIGNARLADFTLDSGIRVKGRAPHSYDLQYRSHCRRMRADLHFESLMPRWTSNSPRWPTAPKASSHSTAPPARARRPTGPEPNPTGTSIRPRA
ncbi:hypothetical protein [Nocardia brevicatena]|uniref:hypothetical protein n=1 Tax=Nocardia brevicatena TaxID=37327 RepID=UPI0002D269B2|nr:hypothetical protein [Nocardia brevicatena]